MNSVYSNNGNSFSPKPTRAPIIRLNARRSSAPKREILERMFDSDRLAPADSFGYKSSPNLSTDDEGYLELPRPQRTKTPPVGQWRKSDSISDSRLNSKPKVEAESKRYSFDVDRSLLLPPKSTLDTDMIRHCSRHLSPNPLTSTSRRPLEPVVRMASSRKHSITDSTNALTLKDIPSVSFAEKPMRKVDQLKIVAGTPRPPTPFRRASIQSTFSCNDEYSPTREHNLPVISLPDQKTGFNFSLFGHNHFKPPSEDFKLPQINCPDRKRRDSIESIESLRFNPVESDQYYAEVGRYQPNI